MINEYMSAHYPKGKLRRDPEFKRSYLTNGLHKFGFQEIRLVIGKYGYFTIEIRFRPALLLDPQNGYYQLISVSDFNLVYEKFNALIVDEMKLPVPKLYQWRVERVEAAIDLRLKHELITLYIQLFKRGYIPSYFMKDETTIKYLDSTTNLYLKASSITVNWYNRYETLKLKEQECGKKYDDYTETKGILRFETQVRNGVGYLHEILDAEFLKKEVLKFYKMIVGHGDFYSISKATEILHHKVINQTKKMRLTRLLRLIDEHGSIYEAKEVILNEGTYSADSFSKQINQLRKLGISPIPIPKEWGVDKLLNFIDLLK
ncbi:hypothetical protein ACX93W_06170 [Paenibacillus sp. CAU 1782]